MPHFFSFKAVSVCSFCNRFVRDQILNGLVVFSFVAKELPRAFGFRFFSQVFGFFRFQVPVLVVTKIKFCPLGFGISSCGPFAFGFKDSIPYFLRSFKNASLSEKTKLSANTKI